MNDCKACAEWLRKMHQLNSDYTHDMNVKDAEIKRLTLALEQANDKILELI